MWIIKNDNDNLPNTLEGSKKNIQQHYDLGNELFEKFLDKSMTYSCAIFKGNFILIYVLAFIKVLKFKLIF